MPHFQSEQFLKCQMFLEIQQPYDIWYHHSVFFVFPVMGFLSLDFTFARQALLLEPPALFFHK
jgi:hypothetical protein